jgi:hypothetical protein
VSRYRKMLDSRSKGGCSEMASVLEHRVDEVFAEGVEVREGSSADLQSPSGSEDGSDGGRFRCPSGF